MPSPEFLDLLQVIAIVGAIVYGAGKIVGSMTATTATLKSGLDQVSKDLEALSKDVGELGNLAAALQGAIGGLAHRVDTLERAGAAAAEAAQEAAKQVLQFKKPRPPKGIVTRNTRKR